MDVLQQSVTNLTGAVNRIVDQLRSIEARVVAIENRPQETASQSSGPNESVQLNSPKTETELKDISKLPDCVKELRTFEGNPTQYISWVHVVEGILKDYEIVKTKPIYRAILQHIRQKVRGSADAALISYNIFDDDWPAMKQCLSLHYADKRDMRTLEHQLAQLSQRHLKLDEYYAAVNHQLSLMINKIKTESYAQETVTALVESYRNRALDVFIRGLNGDLARMLIIQKPKTLPEAYSACLEIQNLNYRSHSIHIPSTSNSVTSPVNQVFRQGLPTLPFRKKFNTYAVGRLPYSNSNSNNDIPPPRPTAPKPHEKMDVSVQSNNVNYMNRPSQRANLIKRKSRSENYSRRSGGHPHKQQRVFNIETFNDADEPTDSIELYEDIAGEEVEDHVNFMTGAHLAYHT